MSQPNVTLLVGKRKKKEEIMNRPTTNTFRSHLGTQNLSLQPVIFQPPVRSLTEVQIVNKKLTLLPPKPALVDLVDDNSPHIASIKTNSPENSAVIDADPVMIMGKNNEFNQAKNVNQTAVAPNKADMKMADNTKIGADQASAATNVSLNATNDKEKGANNTNNVNQASATITAKPIIKYFGISKKKIVVKQVTSFNDAGNFPFTAISTGLINIKPTVELPRKKFENKFKYVVNQPPDCKSPNYIKLKPFTSSKKKWKWLKYQEKRNMKVGQKIDEKLANYERRNNFEKNVQELESSDWPMEDTKQHETSQSEDPSLFTSGTNKLAKNITLKTKQSLQQEMVRQRLNWIKADPKMTGNQPGTSNRAQEKEIQSTDNLEQIDGLPFESSEFVMPSTEKIPQAASPILPTGSTGPATSTTPAMSTASAISTEPIIYQKTSNGTFVKVTSVSTFIPTQPPQPSPAKKRAPSWADMYAYHSYPKGIPKSFLIQQQKQQEAGVAITADSPIWPTTMTINTQTLGQHSAKGENPGSSPIFVDTENSADIQQQYSPSDIYSETINNAEPTDDQESSEQSQGQKRLSAFQRLGPVSQPKKPKLTINLNLNKEQPVREVVNETDDDPDKYTPVHLRPDIIASTDETVVKYLPVWPWRKNVGVRRSVTARHSRSVMILEQEQMEEYYETDNHFIQVSVKGYPSTWTKEKVLDAVLDSVKGYGLIPCFTEFSQHECKFLTLRSRTALIMIHKLGFFIHKDGVELALTISVLNLTLSQIDFIPRIILRKRLAMGYADDKLNLKAFTLQSDISHFIYFPLNRVSNQSSFVQLQSVIAWENLTDLDLSHNRLTDISGFDLHLVSPKLKSLNVSHNLLDKMSMFINYRQLPLNKISLEGNPLCHDYIDPEHYIKVIRMMFPAVIEIDGIRVQRKGELPQFIQNYCPAEAQEVAEKFLEIYFPLLDSGADHRSLVQGMYEDNATLTITYAYKLRYGPIYRCFRNLFLYARFLEEGETDAVVGAMAITKLINRWPHTEHDPYTFSVDVLYHTETTTIIKISGMLKLTADSLADDEHLLSFTRTVVLYSEDGEEYKIQNEMVYWDEPTAEYARSAFRVNTISQKKINLKIEATTDEDLRQKFLNIFMKLTTIDKKMSERCLEINNWNLKLALEHFTKLLKTNELESLIQEEIFDSQETIAIE